MHAAPRRLWSPGNAPQHAARRRSRFFCEQLFEGVDFQIAFSQQPLEPGMLFLELLEALNLVDGHPAIDFAPAIERMLGDTMGAADRRDGLLTFLRLLQ